MAMMVQWVFGPFRLDPRNRCLWQDAVAIALKPKTFAVLQYLVEHAGQLVTKAALLDAVWPETAVSDVVLKVCIADLRKALGDRVRTPQFIATAHRYGYRFVAPVTVLEAPAPQAPALPTARVWPGAPAVAGSANPRRPALPLVEREAALATLQTAWTQARQGQRQVVFITGEAGIGKTAVVKALVAHVSAEPGVWLGQGQCVEQYGTGEAYLPMFEALAQLCRSPQGERLVVLLRQQAPTWLAQMPWLLTPGDRERLHDELHGATRARMLRELATVFDTLTAQTPLLLVLEDLHWSDYATLDLLAFLARHPTAAQVLILGTYRPVEVLAPDHPLPRVVYALQRQGYGLALPLENLSRTAVAAYLTARFPRHAFPERLAAWLHQHTDGTPLFLVTLLTSWIDRGILVEQAGRWQLTAALAHLVMEVPEGLRPLLEQQLARLTPAAQRVLEVASLAGVEFAAPTIAAGLALSAEEVEAHCDALVRQELLRAVGMTTWPDGAPAMRYAFVHALYRHVAAQRLGEGHKQRLHQRLGLRLEAAYGVHGGEMAAELAMHFLRGHDIPRAVHYLRQAADNALHRYANAEAIDHLTTGLAVLHTQPQVHEHLHHELTMRLMLGSAFIAVKGYAAPEVEQTYTRARALGQQVGETTQMCGILFGLWNCAFVRAEHHKARDLGASLLTQAQQQSDTVLRLAGYFAYGASLAIAGALVPARAYLGQGVACDLPDQHGTTLELFGVELGVFCRAWLSHVLWLLGYTDQALACSQENQTQAQALGHPFSQMLALDYAALLHQLRGEAAQTQAHAQAAGLLGTEQAFAYYLAWATILQGWTWTLQQRSAAGMTQMRRGLEALQATGGAVRLPYYWALLAEAAGRAGQVAEGLTFVSKALAHVASTGECWYEAALHRLKGELLTKAQDQRAAALGCFQDALAVARRQDAKALELRAATSLARLWQQQGRQAEAYEVLAPIYGWFTEGFDTADLQEAKALLAELRG